MKQKAIEDFTKTLPNDVIQYVGIAADEQKRLEKLDRKKKISPLEIINWTEADCFKWCEDNDLLSPLYKTTMRGGCWFCYNQTVSQLRNLYHEYPELWKLLLKWDSESPSTFHPDGHTVHDFDRRFQLEDCGLLNPNMKNFRWAMLDGDLQYNIVQPVNETTTYVQSKKMPPKP